jgi:adenylate kinase family enzyme
MSEYLHLGPKLSLKDIQVVDLIVGHGPPNAGKGTQLSILSEGISTGDYVRSAIANPKDRFHSVIAPQARNSEKGGLITDEAICRVAHWRMLQLLRRQVPNSSIVNAYFDGFPRTVGQWELMKSYINAAKASGINVKENHLVFPVSPEECIRRSQQRYELAILDYENAILEGRMPAVNKGEVPRKDDEKIVSRIGVYVQDTIPAIMAITRDIAGPVVYKLDDLVYGRHSLLEQGEVVSFVDPRQHRAIHFIPGGSKEEVQELVQQALTKFR